MRAGESVWRSNTSHRGHILPNQTNICSLATQYSLTRSFSDIVRSIFAPALPRSLMIFCFCLVSFSYFSFLSLIPSILLCLLSIKGWNGIIFSFVLSSVYTPCPSFVLSSYLHLLFFFCFFPLLYHNLFYLFDFFVPIKIRLYFQTTVNTYLSNVSFAAVLNCNH